MKSFHRFGFQKQPWFISREDRVSQTPVHGCWCGRACEQNPQITQCPCISVALDLSPVGACAYLDLQRNSKRDDSFHRLLHQLAQAWGIFWSDLEE